MCVSHLFITSNTGRHFCLCLLSIVTNAAVTMGVQATVPALDPFVCTPRGGIAAPHGSARLHVWSQRTVAVAAAPFRIPTDPAWGFWWVRVLAVGPVAVRWSFQVSQEEGVSTR